MSIPTDAPQGNLGDIVITMSIGNGNFKNTLVSPKCRIFYKTGKGYQQMGLIQKLKIKADCNRVPLKMDMVFPKNISGKLLKSVERSKKICSKLGIDTECE